MNQILKHLKIAVVTSAVIFLVMMIISYVLGQQISFDNILFSKMAYYIMYGVILYGVNALLFIYIDKRYGKNNFNFQRIALSFILTIVVTLLTVLLLRIVEEVVIERGSLDEYLAGEQLKNFLIPFVITIVVSLFFNAFYFYKALQERKIKEQKIIAGTASAKYESLKSQLDPHFLFNSLNVLTSLIEEDPDNAQRFTTALSKVYRYVLEQKDKDLVSLEEELKFAQTYMSLLKMRFENAITFEIPSVVQQPEAKIVPLSLQILLENCIKHNIVSEQQPLKVTIEEVEGRLIVSNNLQKKTAVKKSSRVGLANIKERYKILSTREVQINELATIFKVELPLLTKKASIMNTSKSTTHNSNYVRARKRLDKLKEFYMSLVSYCCVIPFLAFINYKTYWGVQWFWFPMIGWGIGLLFQYFEVHGKDKYFGKSWEDRKIREYMEEENTDKTKWQ